MRTRTALLALVTLLALVATGCSSLEGHLFGPADTRHHQSVRFTVKKGETAGALGERLAKSGLVTSAARWRLFLRHTGGGTCIKAGDFALRPDMAMDALLEALCGMPLPEDVPFTVVEGWRITDIDAALATAGLAPKGAYSAAAADASSYTMKFPFEAGYSLEGYLFPETYKIAPSRFEARTLVQRQLDTFYDRFYADHDGDPAAFSKRSLNDVVIMASLVEREEPDPKMRPKVAGVLWKRLDNGWNLGVDATSRYPLDDWNDRDAFLVQLHDPKDPYNTRLHGGLPPTAIGNPGADALEAAFSPVDSDAWFYLHDENRVVHFGRSAAEHDANRRRYDVW